MNILVTGAKGFIGKNLLSQLRNIHDGKAKNYAVEGNLTLYEYDLDSTPEELDLYCKNADFVFNLAGVNRPQDPVEFMKGNFGFASTLLDTLKKHGNTCPVMISSSIQAALDNPYGESKRAGEQLLFDYAKETGAKVLVYRFPNLFGKWCRPNYNSAVATFCNNIANDLPITVNDPSVELHLVYIDDVVDELIGALTGDEHRDGDFCYVPASHRITLGGIVDLLHSFRRMTETLGFSSALIGSGMAFDYKWFRENIACCTTSGEDKELEALLLRQGIYIDYLDDVRVLDEKVQGEGAYYNQRRRWIAAQFYALSSAVRQLPGAILSGNTDYCDKLLQWCLPPRILLLGLVPLWAVVMTVCAPMGSIKWWVAVLLLLLAMAMALPDEQADARLGHALRRMPVLFLLTLANLFRLRGTKDKFIHTEHTGAGSEAPGNNTGNRP